MPDNELFYAKVDLGDPKVYERIFKKYYTQLTFFANRFVNDLFLAEEIVSDTFTFLWEKRETVEFNSSVKSYLYKTVQNRCLNYLKHKKIENEYVSYLVKNGMLDNMAEGYMYSYSQKELEEQVKYAIEALPERCRQIFKLSRFRYLRNREIAEQLNLSPKTVERQMTIALEKLRKSLRHFLVY